MSDRSTGIVAERRLGPQRATSRSSLRRFARVVGVVLAWLIHAALGVTVPVSGLIMPIRAVMLLGLFWIAGVAVMIRFRRRPQLVVAVPMVSWTLWFTVVWIGDAWLGWVA